MAMTSLFSKVKRLGLQKKKKETLTQIFFCEFFEIFINSYFAEHLQTTTFEMSRSET